MAVDNQDLQNYTDILEKTNQQLSLWFNPYAIMVGVLAILFTILTIVAVAIIYRQSREYKDTIEADRALYKKQISEFLDSQKKIIEENNKTVEETSKKIDEILKQYRIKLEKSSTDQKAEIQKVIDKLELEKLTLKRDIGPITVRPNFSDGAVASSVISGVNSSIFATSFGDSSDLHRCSSCGFGFYVNRGNSITAVRVFSHATVTCPKCGNVDDIRL